MTATELRIGNYIASGDVFKETSTIGKVLEIGNEDREFEQIYCECEESFEWFFKNNYCGIPLTEEWFLKFGFWKEDQKPPTDKHGSYFSIDFFDYKYSFCFAEFREDWGFYHSYTDALIDEQNNKFDFISCGIKYVHQLQNLIYALVQIELTEQHYKDTYEQ